jgi:hypothetical protein
MKRQFGVGFLALALVSCPAPIGTKQSKIFQLAVIPGSGYSGQAGTVTLEFDPASGKGIKTTIAPTGLGAGAALVFEYRTVTNANDVCTATGTPSLKFFTDDDNPNTNRVSTDGNGNLDSSKESPASFNTIAKLGDFLAIFEFQNPTKMPLCLDIRNKTF